MLNWIKFSSVSKTQKGENEVLTFRFNKESASALLSALTSAVKEDNGAVFVATIGKKGNQKHLNGAMLIREKQESQSFVPSGFRRTFVAREESENAD